MARQRAQTQPLPGTAEWKHLHCAFCGKAAEHVRFLSAGVAGGMICDSCCLTAFFIFAKAHVKALFKPRAVAT